MAMVITGDREGDPGLQLCSNQRKTGILSQVTVTTKTKMEYTIIKDQDGEDCQSRASLNTQQANLCTFNQKRSSIGNTYQFLPEADPLSLVLGCSWHPLKTSFGER
eukprot:TRINITY_DN64239_c0_g1_i1.p1 TRINITY_DN64239_c0_g1~~TRINITY_DN64239_c0_g1_i1.p1  ORF type:complete len:106 (-),score=6.87 TRINITY_DN64239_c0_g1_i1:212-529(-)